MFSIETEGTGEGKNVRKMEATRRLARSRYREIDRQEHTARRLARRHRCPCGQRATKGQLCAADFDAAFSKGLVLH